MDDALGILAFLAFLAGLIMFGVMVGTALPPVDAAHCRGYCEASGQVAAFTLDDPECVCVTLPSEAP